MTGGRLAIMAVFCYTQLILAEIKDEVYNIEMSLGISYHSETITLRGGFLLSTGTSGLS